MLYVSTRSKTETFTNYRVLRENIAADGGFYTPFQLPRYIEEEWKAFGTQRFSQAVAQILNLFFSAGISSWDIEFLVGRNPVRVLQVQHKLLAGELWHNPAKTYSYLEQSLWKRICADVSEPPMWCKISVRIAVLFGLYAIVGNLGIHSFDIAIHADDFSMVVAAQMCRSMGMPVDNIIVDCSESSGVWDFIHHGTLSVSSRIPECMELFIHHCFGVEETLRFLECRNSRRSYQLNPDNADWLCKSMFGAVIGENRAKAVVSSVSRTVGYPVELETAQTYAALQDYRAASGENRHTLFLIDRAPSAC